MGLLLPNNKHVETKVEWNHGANSNQLYRPEGSLTGGEASPADRYIKFSVFSILPLRLLHMCGLCVFWIKVVTRPQGHYDDNPNFFWDSEKTEDLPTPARSFENLLFEVILGEERGGEKQRHVFLR
jgi:hypothetical protein